MGNFAGPSLTYRVTIDVYRVTIDVYRVRMGGYRVRIGSFHIAARLNCRPRDAFRI